MLAYRNFRDIPTPIVLEKKVDNKKTVLAAFSSSSTLFFTLSVAAPFLPTNAALVFRSDDDGRVFTLPFLPCKSNRRGRFFYRASLSIAALTNGSQDGLFYYHAVIDTAYGKLYSHGKDGENEAYLTDDGNYASAYQLLVYRPDFSTSDTLKSGVMYQIFVDRFFRGGNEKPREDAVLAKEWGEEISQFPAYPGAPLANNLFYGGDLDGVRKKLDYLLSLGVSVLYLCPIFEAYSNHKYDTGDYMRVDAMFGGEAALKRLLVDAKKRGIKIILDGVFNHTGADSRYFNKNGRYDTVGAYQSVDSPYYHWYHFHRFPDDYACWWGVKILPQVDSSSPDFIAYIAGENGVVDTYIKEGVAGFRLDVVDELSPAMVKSLRKAVKKRGQDGVLIGEVWEDASNKIAYSQRRRYFRGEELDSVMNYPLKNATIDFVINGNAVGFAACAKTLYSHYPEQVSHSLMNFLGTHDTPRILTVLGECDLSSLSYAEMKDVRLSQVGYALAKKRLFLALDLLYLLPGIPCMYYGDEAGMEGAKDPFNRRTYPWGKEDGEIISYVKALGDWRRREKGVLKDGDFTVEEAEKDFLAVSRKLHGKELLLLVNASKKEEHRAYLAKPYKNVRSGQRVQGITAVPPLTSLLLCRK